MKNTANLNGEGKIFLNKINECRLVIIKPLQSWMYTSNYMLLTAGSNVVLTNFIGKLNSH